MAIQYFQVIIFLLITLIKLSMCKDYDRISEIIYINQLSNTSNQNLFKIIVQIFFLYFPCYIWKGGNLIHSIFNYHLII
jgi:hypothetical protein